MKKILQFYSLTILLLTSSSLIGQNQITGTVTDNGTPIANAYVTVEGTSIGTQTDIKGNFSLNLKTETATLIVSFMGYFKKKIPIDTKEKTNFEIDLSSNISTKGVGGAVISVSPKNFWIGAKVGYNFIGNTDDNFFVGSASIAMNVYDGFSKESNHHFAIIGNIGNFKFDKEASNSEDLKKIAQSINGLSVGLGYTYDLNSVLSLNESTNSAFRAFTQTGVRLTSFDDIGEDEETVNLAQSATTLGIEWQLENFTKKGALSVSAGTSMFLFDQNIYNSIFEEERSSLFTIDFTIILPISDQIGFFTNGTFSKDTSAAYILGVIFKS